MMITEHPLLAKNHAERSEGFLLLTTRGDGGAAAISSSEEEREPKRQLGSSLQTSKDLNPARIYKFQPSYSQGPHLESLQTASKLLTQVLG